MSAGTCPHCGAQIVMAPVPAQPEARFVDVAEDFPVEVDTVYKAKSQGRWPWLIRRGRYLVVDLYGAARHWQSAGLPHVAARFQRRAEAALTVSRSREAVGQ